MAQPAPPAPTQPDAEKHKDRIITWRAALLSGGVVLLAGLVGAASSNIVADRQIASQERQSQIEFLRAERQKQYAAFVVQFDEYSDHVLEYMPAEEAPLHTFDSLNNLVDRLMAVTDAMEGIEVNIVLVGSKAAADRASEVLRATRVMISVIYSCARQYELRDGVSVQTGPCDDGTDELDAYVQTTKDFTDQARVDLGADD